MDAKTLELWENWPSEFMKPQIMRGEWYEVDGPQGVECVPLDVCGEVEIDRLDDDPRGDAIPDGLAAYCENHEAWSIERKKGYLARMSAPGYMDCTPWSGFATSDDAISYLVEAHYPETDDDDESPDASCDQCCAAMINGTYCHESGCPNTHKVKVDGEWVNPENDFDEIDAR